MNYIKAGFDPAALILKAKANLPRLKVHRTMAILTIMQPLSQTHEL
jgi:hypothetical protein